MVKRIFLLGLLLVAVILGISNFAGVSLSRLVHLPALFFSERNTETPSPETLPEVQVKGFVQAMQKKNFTKAQSFLLESVQSAYTIETLAQTPVSQGNFVLGSSVLKQKGKSEIAVVVYKIEGKDKNENNQIVELFREAGIWKVGYFGLDDY